MKHRYASSGVQTIGSPRTLNDVLTSRRIPCAPRNARVPMEPRIGAHVDGLNPRRVVDMGDGRDARSRKVELVNPEQLLLVGLGAQLLAHLGDQRHVWTLAIEVEVVGGALGQHRRGERPERLAILDLEVHHRLHLRLRASPRIERFPSARGPNSMRPWNHPTTAPSASSPGDRFEQRGFVGRR